MTQPDISTTITPRIDAIVSNTTHPSNTIIDYAGNPIRSLLQSNPISTVDIWAGARSQAQSYTTVLTNQRNQSVFIPCSTAHPCSSAMILTATNNTAFDLGSLTILPAISSVLTS